MFTGLQPTGSGFRRYRAVEVSVAAHLAVLAVIVFHNPRVIDLGPEWLAYGDGAHTYKLIYFPAGRRERCHASGRRQAAVPAAGGQTAPTATSEVPAPQACYPNLSRCRLTRKPATTTPAPDLRWAP